MTTVASDWTYHNVLRRIRTQRKTEDAHIAVLEDLVLRTQLVG